jgi:hypothetical protein
VKNPVVQITKIYRSRKFRTKVIINFLIINLIITVSVGIDYYFSATNVIKNELTKSVEYSISRLIVDINSFAQSIKEVSDSVVTNTRIREAIISSSEQSDFETQLNNYKSISEIYNSMPYNSKIYRCRIYLENAFDNNIQKLNFINIEKATSTIWYKEVSQSNGELIWTNSYMYKIKENWN